MSLLRPTLIVAAASVGARLLGFARDVLFAQAFGAGPVADAFLAAYRFLDVVRRVVGEGGLNPALVPLLIRLRRDEAARLTGAALAAAGLFLLAVTAIVELAAGLLMAALAPGLAIEGGALGLATLYTRLSWPLAAGIVLASVVSAALNAGGRFTAAALAPLTTGVLTVTALLVLRGTDLAPADRAAWLAAALGLAGVLQLGLVVAAARRHDLLRWWSPFRSVALRRFGLTGPVLIAASGAPHLFIVAGTQVASFCPSVRAPAWRIARSPAAPSLPIPVRMAPTAAGPSLATEWNRTSTDGRWPETGSDRRSRILRSPLPISSMWLSPPGAI